MKKTLLLITTAFLLVFASKTQAQCSDLFFSEYLEGTFNNKALEIYNPTGAAIELSNYRVIRFDNGSIDIKANETMPLPTGTLAANDVYVIVLDIRNPGTGPDTPVFSGLQAKADVFLCTGCNPTTSPMRTMCFNGNDAIVLQKNVSGTWVNVDIFGKIGENPGNSWTNIAPYNNNLGAYWTRDQGLIRKRTVKTGVTENPALFNAPAEWDTIPVNTFDSLGGHRCDCHNFPASLKNVNAFNFNIYPNPAQTIIAISLAQNIEVASISIVNALGSEVLSLTSNELETLVDISSLNTGIYFVKVKTKDNLIAVKKISIQ